MSDLLSLEGCHPGFAEGVRRIVALHVKKSADYGTVEDSLANCRASESWSVPAWVGTMVRASDKVQRLQSLATRGHLTNETAVDTFEDLASYALIARALFLEEEATGTVATRERPFRGWW